MKTTKTEGIVSLLESHNLVVIIALLEMSYFDEKVLCMAFKVYLLKCSVLCTWDAHKERSLFVCEILKLIHADDMKKF